MWLHLRLLHGQADMCVLPQQGDLPADLRRPCPTLPPELLKPLPTDAAGVKAFNDIMFEEYNQASLVPCQGCGRTFLPDALMKHSKGCHGTRSSRS